MVSICYNGFLSRARPFRAPRTMRARHAVPLMIQGVDPRLPPATLLESTLTGTLQVFILNSLKPLRINTYENHAAKAHFAQFWRKVSPLNATLPGSRVCVANKGLAQYLSPLDATLMKNIGGGGGSFFRLWRSPLATGHCTQALSFHILAHSFALFCTRANSTLLFSIDSALFAKKHPGWG